MLDIYIHYVYNKSVETLNGYHDTLNLHVDMNPHNQWAIWGTTDGSLFLSLLGNKSAYWQTKANDATNTAYIR